MHSIILTLTIFKYRKYNIGIMKKLAILTIIGFFSVVFTQSISAKIIEKDYNRIYTVKDNQVEITETKAISVTQNNFFIQSGAEENFTIFNPVRNDPDAQKKAEQTLTSITLTDNFGNNLGYTSETTPTGNLVIKTKINTGIYSGQTYTITLKYISYGLIIKSGAVRDVYVPAFSKSYTFEDEQTIERVTTQVIIPKFFGEINIVRPLANISDDGNNYVLNFTQESLLGATAWIQIGKIQYYSFNIEQPFEATSNIPIVYNQFRIILPRDMKSGPITQEVHFTNISPEPFSTELDSDGNLIAIFKVPVNESGTIKVEGYAIINQNNSIDFVKSGTINDIPLEVIERNTASAKYWESDSEEIQELAKELKGTETNVYKLVENAYQYVVGKIDYSEVKKFGLNQRQGALATLRGGAAVCMEYSDLFIALLRAMGIPARAAFGSGYSALDGLTSSSNTVNHQWAEVYIPSINSWIGVDTTWGENGDTLIGGDLNHFYTHITSIDPETPSSTEAILYGRAGSFKDKVINVDAVGGKPAIESLSQEQILTKYPQKDTNDNFVESVLTGSTLLFNAVNNQFNTLLTNAGVPSNVFNVFKIGIVLFIIVTFIVLFVLIRKFIKKNEATHKN